jgi:hypothetical protein
MTLVQNYVVPDNSVLAKLLVSTAERNQALQAFFPTNGFQYLRTMPYVERQMPPRLSTCFSSLSRWRKKMGILTQGSGNEPGRVARGTA